ncbi:cysteine proteinase, partial [Coniochaeta sp. PMI_546]
MHGYSSSSESDSDYRRKRNQAPPATTTTNDKTKVKKRKLPPQITINRVWKRFSKKKFTKALAVLPFDPVPPPIVSERANELLRTGYERAAEECRRKVRKIIQECRRVNMRYRDPGFDLDWDLKMEKGHCLNSLGRTKFDLSATTMLNPSATVPKAVKRVHEIFESPKFMDKISGSDVKQGSLGDCWLMASFSGLANVEDGIKRICVEYDTRIGIYGFVFFRDGEWIYSIIDDKLYLKSPFWDSPSMQRDLLQQIDREDVERVYRKTYQTGSKALFFAQCKDQNETWVPLIEKAYAKAHGDFASLSGGWIGEGLEDLSGGVTTELLSSDILDLDGFWENELSKVNEEFLFGCSTGLLDGGYGDRDGISEGHAYVVMKAKTLKNGTRLVQLRNPWGKTKKGIWEGAWSDGSKEWTTEVQEEIGHNFGGDSVFWISYEDMLRKYQHFDRTRLFRDPDWRMCQRWIGVDVPWKPQFNEKFHIKLTRESPLVLVLSQLDNRYYKGLHGQYYFRLHFRIHEVNRPGAEDYIVRSHGNYLMNRSVSIELPSMLPGEYSVFISVVGERNSAASSIEDVVKREVKKREENEKLVQVGYAYDLAHSKATAHLEAVRALRKKADQKRASNARRNERQKLWEKRHLNRDITKKQGRKNNEKIDAKKEAEKESKEKAETEAKEKTETEEAEKKEAEEKGAEDEAKTEDVDNAVQTDNDTATQEDKSSGDVTPDWTPVATPVATPLLEKTEDQASGHGATVTPEVKPAQAQSEQKPDRASDDKAKEADPADIAGSDSSGSPKDTPKTDVSTPDADSQDAEKVTVPPADDSKISGAPPAAPATSTPAPASEAVAAEPAKPAPPKKTKTYATSDGESSASPISDWEELYSSDDMTRKPRVAGAATTPAYRVEYVDDTDGENDPDPWNAIAVVGLRVYSKDEDLELRVVMEGGLLEEGGMGEKGEVDLDNAQANAGGQRGPLVPKEDGGYEGDSEIESKTNSKKDKK